VWPVKGKILKPFGDASSGQKNEGINIAAPADSPVVATDNGVVAHVGNQIRGYGYVVLIKHASGKISVYGHLKSASVKANQSVKAGQEIGKVGTTGGVSQPQLHFELRQGKKALNPTDYLK
jgi:murein DD-endopeptidase MepM/ murein hydrolase activator NlpD